MNMGTLMKLKTFMKLNGELRPMLVRGGIREILLDVDGDKEADIALIDTDGDGDIDTVAIDLTGDGEFNVYIRDTDGNNIPDTVLFVGEGEETSKVISGSKEETEKMFIEGAVVLYKAIMAAEYVASQIEAGLRELDKEVRRVRKELKI
jgi:hypothetical protein